MSSGAASRFRFDPLAGAEVGIFDFDGVGVSFGGTGGASPIDDEGDAVKGTRGDGLEGRGNEKEEGFEWPDDVF